MERKIIQGIGVIGKIDPNPTNYTFKLIQETGDKGFAEYREAINVVNRISASRQLQLVERNRAILASVAAFYRNAIGLKRRSQYFEPRNAVENLSFEVLNWLTATRLFIDHHLTSFASDYGENSDQRQQLQAAIRNEYDNSMAYRFLYKLRDYTQHCGFPVDQVTLAAANPDKNKRATTVEFTAGRDRLLANFDWKSKVREDLLKMPERIDVLELIEQASPCFRRIFAEITKIRIQGLSGPVAKIREIAAVCDDEEGLPHLLTFVQDDDGGVKSINHEAVPTDMIAWLDGDIGPSEYLNRLTQIASVGEPSELAAPTNLNEGTQQSIKIGAGVLNAYFENGGINGRFTDTVNKIADDLGGITPVLVGVTTVAAVGLSMAAAALGTNSREILGGMVLDSAPSDDGP
jgi:hypothetical protein